jgi:hypothetical protein
MAMGEKAADMIAAEHGLVGVAGAPAQAAV